MIQKVRIPNSATALQLHPYLTRLDETKTYSNFGHLNQIFIERLQSSIFNNQYHITTHTNGTLAIITAILAAAGLAKSGKKKCLMPSYTFIATASAAISCGYEPYFVDIDETNLMMDIENLRDQIPWNEVGLILPVCAYGIIGHLTDLIQIADKKQIPIVIDGAAAFDTLPSDFPLGNNAIFCLSTHATKSFNSGEGGLTLSKNPETSKRIRAISNFGIDRNRVSKYSGTNSKMSEYHAAVGLANLDIWDKNKEALQKIREKYLTLFNTNDLNPNRTKYSNTGSHAYFLIKCPEHEKAYNALTAKSIDFRLWYEHGLHKIPQFENCGKTSLEKTNYLSSQILGIPAHIFLSHDDISYIVNTLTCLRRVA